METGSKPVTRGPCSTGRSPAGRRGVQEGARMTHREGYYGHEVPGALVCGAVVWDPWGRGRAEAWGGGGNGAFPPQL